MQRVNYTTSGEIANSAYKNPEKQAETAKKYGYEIDKNLSKVNTTVWRKANHDPVIVHRGSHTWSDWGDDALISLGLGKYTHRYKNAQRVTKRVREAEGGKRVTHVGHSLGGYLAEQAGAKHKDKVYTYNKHSFGFQGGVNNDRQTDVRTPGDLASAQSYLFGGAKERSHRKVTEGTRGIIAPFHRNTLINPLYAHKTTRKSLYKNLY